MQTNKQTNKQTHRWTEGQKKGQTNRQTDRQTSKHNGQKLCQYQANHHFVLQLYKTVFSYFLIISALNLYVGTEKYCNSSEHKI